MGVDLKKELEKQRDRSNRKGENEVMQAFRKLLTQDDEKDADVLSRIFESNENDGEYHFGNLEESRIYSLSDIKELCIQYRLRFLDASLFKGEIPYEAISQIKELEKKHQVVLSDFKMLAPAPMFNLQRKDRDPLLFLNLGEGHFYLIHKWGRDLHPLRKLLVFPFRNFKTLLLCVLGLAAIIAWLIPDSVIAAPQGSAVIRVIFFFYLFFGFSGLTILYGFSRMKDFNSNLWNSKYTD